MQNRMMVVALFVLVGGVAGLVVGGTHTAAGKGARKAGATADANVMAPKDRLEKEKYEKALADKSVKEKAPMPTALPAVMEVAQGPEPAQGVPVAGTGNASGVAAPEVRKSLIPGPDDGPAAGSEGKQ